MPPFDFDFRAIARVLITLSDRTVLYWSSMAGSHPSNVSNWLRGRETLSEENVGRLLSALSVDPASLTLDPSRVHLWIVSVHEPDSLAAAAEQFLESPIDLALVSPDPSSPGEYSQAPRIALLRNRLLRVVLVRKLFTAKVGEESRSQKAGAPWIDPSMIPGSRWRAKGIPNNEPAPPILLAGPFLFDLAMGQVSLEQFDAILDKAAPWDWKDVEKLARKAGLSARDAAERLGLISPLSPPSS